jgi:hypothetical protein
LRPPFTALLLLWGQCACGISCFRNGLPLRARIVFRRGSGKNLNVGFCRRTRTHVGVR